MIINIGTLTAEKQETIRKFINSAEYSSLESLEWGEAFQKTLLFPTDDFHLQEEQYNCIISLLNKSELLYVMKMDYDLQVTGINNEVYEISAPFDYDEYEKIWLDTPSVVFSDSGKWIVIIDELAEYGEGLFIGEEIFSSKFLRGYTRKSQDIIEYIEFFTAENLKRGVPLNHMTDVLKLCGINS